MVYVSGEGRILAEMRQQERTQITRNQLQNMGLVQQPAGTQEPAASPTPTPAAVTQTTEAPAYDPFAFQREQAALMERRRQINAIEVI